MPLMEPVPWARKQWSLAHDPCEDVLPSDADVITLAPEVVLEVPDARVLFCCYDASEPSQCAAVAALFGEAGVSGRLPVDVPPLLQLGDGLKR